MKINRQGITRIVILTKRYAIKIPNFTYCQQHILWGLLGNLNEANVSKNKQVAHRICPVLFHLPLGLLVVMPRVEVLNDLQYHLYYKDIQSLLYDVNEDSIISAESKSDSYGFYKGNVVVIDYGS
jgi:hypothetical protein